MPGRNMLAQNGTVKRQQEAGIYILGWIAQADAIVGGTFAADSWPGQAIRWCFELVPWQPFIPVVLFVGAIAWGIDIVNDLTPNQVAITYGFLGPILAASVHGELSSRIRDWSHVLQGNFGGKLATWAGNPGGGAMAIICIASAVLIGRRVLAKQASAAGGGGR
jgi:hypothetical protein